MPSNLTNSPTDRQNILNNGYALSEIEKATKLRGVNIDNVSYVIKEQIASFFEIDTRTVERYLEQYGEELTQSGYEVLTGKRLSKFKLAASEQFGTDINVGTKTTVLGVFSFRAFLNIGMLITEGERARLLRQMILDIAIDTINQKTGGATKYINQRDEYFINSLYEEENYRKQFTDALKDCVDMGNFKYAVYTNKIYVSIFREKAHEYRDILKLKQSEKVRDTLYSEVLDIIASYECGLADTIRKSYESKGRMLHPEEVDSIFSEFESMALWKPQIENARRKMASRDLCFRDALHKQLEEYIAPVDAADFERFLGEKSMELNERLEEAKDVLKRLKERE